MRSRSLPIQNPWVANVKGRSGSYMKKTIAGAMRVKSCCVENRSSISCVIGKQIVKNKQTNKLRGFSSQAICADRATAACRRS
jgi:hypothetical protein